MRGKAERESVLIVFILKCFVLPGKVTGQVQLLGGGEHTTHRTGELTAAAKIRRIKTDTNKEREKRALLSADCDP